MRERGAQVIGPEDGPLAEGESGPGRLSEPVAIVQALAGIRGQGAAPATPAANMTSWVVP